MDEAAIDQAPAGERSLVAIGLGVAGLLPPLLALASRWLGQEAINQPQVVLVYSSLILSFVGGSWWGIALLRSDGRWRSILLLLGIGASLSGFCIQGLASPALMRPLLLVLALLVGTSWLVDRALVADGMIGAWWGRLRLALSAGLGALTLAMGMLS